MQWNIGILNKKFRTGSERTNKVFKNITHILLYKGLNVILQLILVPLTINYLDKDQYGIWLTLSAIIGWFSFFDIGLGNGLRNKVAEAISNNDKKLAKTYISTAYTILACVFGLVIFVFFIANHWIVWYRLLNAPKGLEHELSLLGLVAFTFFCLRFIFSLISNILYAVHEAAVNTLIATIGNVLSVIMIYSLRYFINGSLLWAGIILSAVPVLVLFVVTFFLFEHKLKEYKPSLSSIDFKLSRQLFGLGFKFFIIQIAEIVLFSCSELIITQFYGPAQVTSYNIAFRYFMVLTMLYGIINTPLWSAFTEAYVRKDYIWIKSIMSKLNIISVFFVVMAIIMIIFCNPIYQLWVGKTVSVSKALSITIGIYVIFHLVNTPYISFINGTGKVKLQYLTAIISIFITIPLAIIFIKSFSMGPAGVVWATLCTTIPCTVLFIIQYNRLIKSKASGIWNG